MKRLLLGVVVVALLAAGFGVWWYLIRDDAPPPVTLVERDSQPSDTIDTSGTSDTSGTAAESADGRWVVTDAEETFAGFRITEHFVGGIDNTAVVRSPAVTGSMTIDGATISDATVEVDLTALASQDAVPPGVPGVGNRVDQMRTDGLEIDTFPTATFVLTSPVVLDAVPALGEPITADATGDLTIHGVTKAVTVPIEARWNGDLIDVAGSLQIDLADYGMNPPERRFVTVDDTGTMEFQLAFERPG